MSKRDEMRRPAKLAVYAGTFDPITNGHCDIVECALRVFDELIVAVAADTSKNTLFSLEDRVSLVQEALDCHSNRVRVESFSGLLVDYVHQVGAGIIIRGLRAVSDYEYEAQMAVINRRLRSDVETVYFVASEYCSFVSSSVVREVARNRGDVSTMVPPNVDRRLKQVFGRNCENA